ncbi:MAG: hypothetical protein RL414_194 [Actinomycetota bacterium]
MIIKKNAALLATTLLAVGALSGCTAAGKDAPTSKIRQVTDGVEADSGSVKVRNFILVAQEDGSAVLVSTIVNQEEPTDAITSITANGVSAKITGDLVLAKNSPVIFSGDSANASAIFPNLGVTIGHRANVEIAFANAPKISTTALVVEKSAQFANVSK